MSDSTRHLLLSQVLPVVAILIAIFAAFYQLSESPAVWYDEGFFEQGAMNLVAHGAQVMQLAPGHYLSSWSISAGYPLMAPIALMFKWFGTTVWNARAVTATYLVLFIIVAYAYARRELGHVPAIIAALLLVTFPLLYGNGKAVLGEVPALFYLALTLYALDRLRERGYASAGWLAAAGFFAGLAFATKFTFMFLAPGIVLALYLRRSHLRELSLKAWILAATAFLLPILLWIHLQFGPGDSVGEFFGYASNPYENSSIFLLIISNLKHYLTELTPLYALSAFVIWVASAIIRARKRVHVSLAEVTALVFSTCIMLAYLVSPGWYKYFFSATCVSLIFLPSAALTVWDALRYKLPLQRRLAWLPYAGFACLILFQAYQLAHHSYVADYYHSNRTEVLEAYFNTVDPNKSVFLYNVPEVGIFLPNPANVYQFVSPHPEQRFGAENLPLLAEGRVDMVVVNAETYAHDAAPFGSYHIVTTIAHYDILQKP